MLKLKVLKISIILLMLLAVVAPFGVSASPLALGTSPTLVALANYSVLGGGSITNVPTTTTNGDIRVAPGAATGGGYAGGGTIHSNDSSSIAAQAEALTTFGALTQLCDQNLPTGTDLSVTDVGAGVGSYPPGVYCSAGSFLLTTTMTLSGSGVWIFQTVSTLVTSPGSVVNGGDPCNVWWRIGSSTTLDTTTSFIGTVISQTGANAMNTNATLNGRFLALSGATVTLDQNTITSPNCTPPVVAPTSESGSGRPSVRNLPNTGGAPIREDFPWNLAIFGGVGVIALVFGVRLYRNKLSKH